MRVFCENCGRNFDAGDSGATLCDKCRGGHVDGRGGEAGASAGSSSAAEKAVNAVSSLAGLEGVKGFTWSGLFSEVFRRHSHEEYSRFWSTGSVGNIPAIGMVETGWPRPWMFVRGCLLMAVFCLLLFIGWKLGGNNVKLLPGLMTMGSLLAPLTILLFFFEINARRNVSLAMTMKTFLIGGALSLLLAMPLFNLAYTLGLGLLGASVAGIVEESAKLLAVVLFVRGVSQVPYILNGLLFGAAVGAGFAAFESMGYAMETLLQNVVALCVDNMDAIVKMIQTRGAMNALGTLVQELSSMGSGELFSVVCLRGCLACLTGHILWTAMSAAALWMVRAGRPFHASMLTDKRFLRIFLIAVVSHMLWNCSWAPALLTPFDKYILLGIVNWIVVFAIITKGLSQLKAEKASATVEVEAGVTEAVEEQKAYVETIARPALPLLAQPEDHLHIRQETAQSAEREHTREAPRYSGRAWQNYYKRER